MKLKIWLITILLFAGALTVGVSAYGPENLTIPASAESIVYGQSGAGRNLMAYRFGTGTNVLVVGFAIHGYEDNWSRDAEALVYTAGKLMEQLDANIPLLVDYNWSVYVLPCMNPDGLLDGYTNNGPGRCTTSYYDRSGNLSYDSGIDLNRSFPVNWIQRSAARNFNGYAPLASKEAQALAQFVQTVKGTGANLCIDTHGWFSQIITSNGYSKLYEAFRENFPGNSFANLNNASGYFTAYTASLGYASCLFEFPDGIYSLGGYIASGYCEKYCTSVMGLLTAYSTSSGHSALCPSMGYTDLSLLGWYHTAADYVLNKGIFVGTSSTTFAPNGDMNRAMVVTTLWRMAGSPVAAALAAEPEPDPDPDPDVDPDPVLPSSGFYDVPEGQWYTDAVVWARENGVVTGYPDGNFRPEASISREEMATIFYRHAVLEGKDVSKTSLLSAFPDGASVSEYAKTPMAWAYATGLIQGIGTGNTAILSPKTTASRVQVAAVIMRYLEGENATTKAAVKAATLVEPNIEGENPEELNGN